VILRVDEFQPTPTAVAVIKQRIVEIEKNGFYGHYITNSGLRASS